MIRTCVFFFFFLFFKKFQFYVPQGEIVRIPYSHMALPFFGNLKLIDIEFISISDVAATSPHENYFTKKALNEN